MRFTRTTAEPGTRRRLERFDLEALVTVPIVGGEEFLGVLQVGVVGGPDRLELAPALLSRLRGVAALAAPALQNGRFVERLHHEAHHDALTGLLNRAGFMRRIDAATEGTRRKGDQAGLLFLDLDGFKRINDAHGHDAGDALLEQVARRLESCTRADDVAARLGGDEFAVILSGVRGDDDLDAAAARVSAALEGPFAVGAAAVRVGASVGAALWPRDGATTTALIRHADEGMYRQKEAAPGRRDGARSAVTSG